MFVICVKAIMYLLLHNLHRVSKALKSSKHQNTWFQMKEHLNIQHLLFKYLVFFLFHVSF